MKGIHDNPGITGYRCKACGCVMYPSHFRCLHCEGREFEQIEPGETGTLVTWTEVWNLPWGIDERSRTIGIVAFDDGVKAMGQLKVEDPRPGMRLEAQWAPVRVIQGEQVYGLIFERPSA